MKDSNPPSPSHKYPPLPSLASLGLAPSDEKQSRLAGTELTKMGKFRFQLFADWIAANFKPCRVADVGGGKGLLSYFLNQHKFAATVIDPFEQALPDKIKDIHTGERLRFTAKDQPPRISIDFNENLQEKFDLFVALHAHGCNISIINLCASSGKKFAVLPCCVIAEPLTPPIGINWFTWLSNYAQNQGIDIGYFKLNFKGQNIGLFSK